MPNKYILVKGIYTGAIWQIVPQTVHLWLPLLLYPSHCAAHHNWSAPLLSYSAWGPGHSIDHLCPWTSLCDPLSFELSKWTQDLLLGAVSHSSHMDDILIAMSTSLQDHRDATHDVLDLLQKHDLFLKKKKCRWEVDSIDYLGLILEKGVTHMDLTKLEDIYNWHRPTKVKDIPSFLGFCNLLLFYPRFFQNCKTP